jgi:hypothetical protein
MANFIEMFELIYSDRLKTPDPKFDKMTRVEYAQWALQNMHKSGFAGLGDPKTARALLMSYIKEFSK